MGHTLLELNSRIQQFVWGTPMLIAFLGTGLYFSIRTGFFQFTGVRIWLRETLMRKDKTKASSGGFRALCTALAGTLGTGNIAGVATAIASGGPGAIFWMWVSAFLGMMTGFAEKCLGAKYGKGEGGTMAYMEHGLHAKPMAVCYAVLCAVSTAGAGNMVQVNSVAEAAKEAFRLPPFVTAVLIAGPVYLVVLGGIKRISAFTERLIPALTIVYLLGCIAVICIHAERVPEAFSRIFAEAFSLKAGLGGAAGYGMKQSIRLGVARGIFSNEAGMGSSVLAYGAAKGEEPARLGMWGMLEVWIDTILVCTLTALVILTGTVYDAGTYSSALGTAGFEQLVNGAALTSCSFAEVFGYGGLVFVALAMYLFAFPSIICWCYYGTVCVRYVFGEKAVSVYKTIFIGMILLGSQFSVRALWELADSCNGLMAIPNLIALLLLSGEVIAIYRDYRRKLEKEKKM